MANNLGFKGIKSKLNDSATNAVKPDFNEKDLSLKKEGIEVKSDKNIKASGNKIPNLKNRFDRNANPRFELNFQNTIFFVIAVVIVVLAFTDKASKIKSKDNYKNQESIIAEYDKKIEELKKARKQFAEISKKIDKYIQNPVVNDINNRKQQSVRKFDNTKEITLTEEDMKKYTKSIPVNTKKATISKE